MRASAAQMVTAWETQREGLSQTGRKEPWAGPQLCRLVLSSWMLVL